jgi:hypothetical protein
LFSSARAEILLSSTLAIFSASLMESAFTITTKSSAKATIFVWLV